MRNRMQLRRAAVTAGDRLFGTAVVLALSQGCSRRKDQAGSTAYERRFQACRQRLEQNPGVPIIRGGCTSADVITTWSFGSNTASGPGRQLRLYVDIARLGETNTDSTGRRTVVDQYRDTSIDPLANSDLSGRRGPSLSSVRSVNHYQWTHSTVRGKSYQT